MSTGNTTSTPSPPAPHRASQPARAAQRSPWVDIGKGLLIVLVVLGHLVGGLTGSHMLGSSQFWLYLYQWIYAFHMPAFMLLAGLFLERSLRVGFGPFVLEKARTLYYPRVLWGFLCWGLLLLMANYANSKPSQGVPWKLLYDPLADFWFLMTLFLFTILYAALRTARVPRGGIATVAIAGTVAAQFLGAGWPALATHLCWYFGWLMAGAAGADVLLSERVGERSPPSAVLGALAILGWGVMTLQIPYTQDGPPPFMLQWAIPGTIASLACSIALGRWAMHGAGMGGVFARGLAYLGTVSLQIYLVGGIGSVGSRVLLTRFLHIQNMWALLVAGMVAGIGAPLVFNWLCERVGFHYAFRFGRRGGGAGRAA